MRQRAVAARRINTPTIAMRAVIQRVSSAQVEVEGKSVGSIGKGLLVLVGLKAGDTEKDLEYMSRKVLNSRLFPASDGAKMWDQSVSQLQLEVLIVSQFTLYGFLKGNKPDYHLAMPPQQAQEMYNYFVQRLKQSYAPDKVAEGTFGAMMQVSLVNDGPVTLQLDSDKDAK
ncbi:hypothetical protein WJX73_005485 [Symbiochloris irregularis]|uniref:D-aminoacyl-tRNA deacylase n=1 Tax=Symbiochloris irregularis TaxID=706552 RepID=A0AAW1NQB9_9CHLO